MRVVMARSGEAPEVLTVPLWIKAAVAMLGSLWGGIDLLLRALTIATLLDIALSFVVDRAVRQPRVMDRLLWKISQTTAIAAVVWLAYIVDAVAQHSGVLNPSLPILSSVHLGTGAAVGYFAHATLNVLNGANRLGLVSYEPLRRFAASLTGDPRERPPVGQGDG